MTTTLQSIKLPSDILASLHWDDNDEINIKEEAGRIVIEKVEHIPNAETIAAIKEVEEMKKNPHLYKGYDDVDEMMRDILRWNTQ